MKRTNLFIACLAVAFAANQTARAAVVNVDLGTGPTYSGTAVVGTGTFWTGVAALSDTNLLEDDGVTNSGFGFVLSAGTNGGLDAPIDLFDDYSFQVGGSRTLTINGLNDANTYNVVLFGAQNGFGGRGSSFDIGGTTKVTSGDNGGSAFVEGNSYVRFDGESSASGAIVVTLTDGTDGLSIFNGFQIEEIAPAPSTPEPSTLLLAGIGLVGLVVGRRRGR